MNEIELAQQIAQWKAEGLAWHQRYYRLHKEAIRAKRLARREWLRKAEREFALRDQLAFAFNNEKCPEATPNHVIWRAHALFRV